MKSRKIKIGVLGPHDCSDEEFIWGFEVGKGIAKADAILVCGGLDGMMTEASRGAKSEDGLTIGILPGSDADTANAFIDIAIPTGLGLYRNALIANICDAVIAIGGRYGTLSEIAFALRSGTPVIGLGSWAVIKNGNPDTGIIQAFDPGDAVKKALGVCN